MPKQSEYQQRKAQELKELAFELYKEGLPLRAVAARIGRSHTFVLNAVRELDPK